jgi:predicted nucleotidyltransferase
VRHSNDPLVPEDTYHPALEIDLPYTVLTPGIKLNQKQTLAFRRGDYASINNYLSSVNWSQCLSTPHIDDAVERFYNILNKSIELHIPKKATKNSAFPRWYSTPLIKIIKEKDKYHKKWKTHGDYLDYESFSILRKRQKKLQTECYKNFITISERSIKSHPKYFWTFVKNKRKFHTIPKNIQYNGVTASDDIEVTELFSTYFLTTFNSDPNLDPCLSSINSKNNIAATSNIIITENIVLKYLKTIDVSKGTGSDNIPPVYLINCADELAYPLSIIFKKSLRDGTFPHKWKEAFVIPIFKNGSTSRAENYRPISILSVLSKLFERIVYDQLYPAICKNISEKQHGFMQRRSVVTNLAIFSSYLLNSMDKKSQVDTIYTDFSKAFDRVNHTILIQKLELLGIHGDLLRWLTSYIHNRCQAVVIGGHRSNFISIPSGVPQGSHLGPLLFNSYINDIGKCFQHANYILYADDLKLYTEVNSLADCHRLQEDIERLTSYCDQNLLTLNASKCQSIYFTRNRTPIKFQYEINSAPIPFTPVVRDLGVLLDIKLNFNAHIDHIAQKSSKALGFVLRTGKPFTNTHVIKLLYFSYVRSILEFASTIWSPTYKSQKIRLEKVQKRFIKHLRYHKSSPPTQVTQHNSTSTHNYNINSLESRRTVHDIKFLHQIIHNAIDSIEIVQSSICLNVPQKRTRSQKLFHIPKHNTNYASNAVFVRIMTTYNNFFSDTDILHLTFDTFTKTICEKTYKTNFTLPQ